MSTLDGYRLKDYPEHQVIRLTYEQGTVPFVHWADCRSFRKTARERTLDGSAPDCLQVTPSLVGCDLVAMLWQSERDHRRRTGEARLYFCDNCMSEQAGERAPAGTTS